MPISIEELNKRLKRPIKVRCSPYGYLHLRPFTWEEEDISVIQQMLGTDLSDREFVVRFIHDRLTSPTITIEEVRSWRIDKLSRVVRIWAADERGLDKELAKGPKQLALFRRSISDKITKGPLAAFSGLTSMNQQLSDTVARAIGTQSVGNFFENLPGLQPLKPEDFGLGAMRAYLDTAHLWEEMRPQWSSLLDSIGHDAFRTVLSPATIGSVSAWAEHLNLGGAAWETISQNLAFQNASLVEHMMANIAEISTLRDLPLTQAYITDSLQETLDSLLGSVTQYSEQLDLQTRPLSFAERLELQAPVLSSAILVGAIRDEIVEVEVEDEVEVEEPTAPYGGSESTVKIGISVLQELEPQLAEQWARVWDFLYGIDWEDNDNAAFESIRQAEELVQDLARLGLGPKPDLALGILQSQLELVHAYLGGDGRIEPTRARVQVTTLLTASIAVLDTLVRAKSEAEPLSKNDIIGLIEGWGETSYQGKPIDVARVQGWLEQFDPEPHRRLMAKLLQNINFYNESRIRKAVRLIREHVLDGLKLTPKLDAQNKHTIVSGFGTLANSGLVYAHMYCKEAQISEDRAPAPNEILAKLKEPGYEDVRAIVFVDDIIGSGETYASQIASLNAELLEYLKENSITVFFTAVCGTEEGREIVRAATQNLEFPTVVYIPETLSEKDRCFSDKSSVFSTAEDRIEAESIAREKGRKIFSSNPLGYGGGQFLVVFYNNCPDNTLPIIWSAEGNWRPLFPRQF